MFFWSVSQFIDCDSQRDSGFRSGNVSSQHHGFCPDREYPSLWHVFIPCQSHCSGGYGCCIWSPDSHALCPRNNALVTRSHQDKNRHLSSTSQHLHLQLFLGRNYQDQLSGASDRQCELGSRRQSNVNSLMVGATKELGATLWIHAGDFPRTPALWGPNSPTPRKELIDCCKKLNRFSLSARVENIALKLSFQWH